MIPIALVEQTAAELMRRASVRIPEDYRAGVRDMMAAETGELSRFVLATMLENWEVAEADGRPMCADTGLPRYYVKAGNEARIEGGFVALEAALRRATAQATHAIPLRPNRVHPLTRADRGDNVGVHAPEVTYAFEPEATWLDVTTVHKGGLFGTDYRMLFAGDGLDGVKRFFLDVLIAFGRRGLACQPAIVGVGLGGAKDTAMRLGKEAACLRVVGDAHPEREIAALERELCALGNEVGMGAMGFPGHSMVVDCHVEIAHTHTGGLPMSVHCFCLSSRRASARIEPGGAVTFRTDPAWFTPYYRREGLA